jgi:hypothetical protein
VPGRWRQQFHVVPGELAGGEKRRLYLCCRLIVTLSVEAGGAEVDAVHEDVGELDAGSFAGLKALYSDARKRAGVAAGIGAYVYTTLEAVVLAIGANPRPGSMFLGRRVDDAITLYYRRILEHHERLDVDQVKDAYRDGWRTDAEAEHARLGIAWEDELPAGGAFNIGLQAIELTSERLVPQLGEPVAVQRKVEYTVAPGLDWSVLCYLDLEEPWGFADPGGWKCTARYCEAWGRCPGGAGL